MDNSETQGLQILFGKKRTVIEMDDGSSIEREEAMANGKVLNEYAHYRETIKATNVAFTDHEVFSHFLDFQEFLSKRPGFRLNPTFEQKSDPTTGKTVIIYRQWTEKVK